MTTDVSRRTTGWRDVVAAGDTVPHWRDPRDSRRDADNAAERIASARQRSDDIVTKARAWARVFERTDRILSGDFDMTVTVLDELQALYTGPGFDDVAGWTDGQSVMLNAAVLGRLLDAAKTPAERASVLASFYAVNLHELAHNVFTPRVDDAICDRVRAYGEGAFGAMNVLEDQRAETLFVATYGPARQHFRRMALHQIIERNDPNDPLLVLLLWGRKFIDRDVRVHYLQACRAQYPTLDVDALLEIINEYRTLAYPRDELRMEELILRFHEILNGSYAAARDFSQMTRSIVKGHGEQQEGLPDDDQNDSAADRAAADAESGSDEQDSDSADGSEGDESGSADAETGDDESEVDESPDGDAPDSDALSGSGGSDEPDESSNVPAVVAAALADATDAIRDDIESLEDSAAAEEDEQAHSMNVRGYDASERSLAHDVAPEQRVALRRVQRAFAELRAELEAGWTRQQPSGRINVLDYLNADPGDFDVFDSFDPGADDSSDIELVLLIDNSQSMRAPDKRDSDVSAYYDSTRGAWVYPPGTRTRMDEAMRAAWVIHHAVLRLPRGRVTVLGFDARSEPTVMYRPGDRPRLNTYDVPFAEGGTDPTGALREALQVVKRSDRSNKLVVILTDGEWQNVERAEAMVRLVRKAGAHVALFGLADAVKLYGAHECVSGHDIAEPMDVVTATRDLVRLVLLRNRAMA